LSPEEDHPGIVQLELDFRLVLEPGYLAGVKPKLNVVTNNELFRPLHRFGIVGAFEWNCVVEMPVRIDDVNAVLWHGAAPFDQAGAQDRAFSSPMTAIERCGDDALTAGEAYWFRRQHYKFNEGQAGTRINRQTRQAISSAQTVQLPKLMLPLADPHECWSP
jgi:hypothetical protein